MSHIIQVSKTPCRRRHGAWPKARRVPRCVPTARPLGLSDGSFCALNQMGVHHGGMGSRDQKAKTTITINCIYIADMGWAQHGPRHRNSSGPCMAPNTAPDRTAAPRKAMRFASPEGNKGSLGRLSTTLYPGESQKKGATHQFPAVQDSWAKEARRVIDEFGAMPAGQCRICALPD